MSASSRPPPPRADPEAYARVAALAASAPPPVPGRRILTGSAGWTDPTLLASGFYPTRARSPAARLRHYASQLGMVEVDSTYYALPAPRNVEGWIRATPAHFVFDVKAHPAFTRHALDLRRLPRDLIAGLTPLADPRGRVPAERVPAEVTEHLMDRFVALLAPLRESARLGMVLLQFPPWFGPTRGNARWVERLRARYPELPLAVELRHGGWWTGPRRERWLDLLRAHRLAHVVVDGPVSGVRGTPAVWEVTLESLALVRLHGHNLAGWTRPGATVHERFDWLYSPEELQALVPRVKELGHHAERVHVVFNNCVHDHAVLDARALAALLDR